MLHKKNPAEDLLVTLAAPFRGALESRQRVGNPGVQLLRAPMLQNPAPPSRREGKLSAEAHAAGARVERDTGNVIVNRNAERHSRRQIDYALRVVYVLDGSIHIPPSTERGCPCLDALSSLRGTLRRNSVRLRIPPLRIIRRFGQQIPNALRGRVNNRDGTCAKCRCLVLLVWSPIPEPSASRPASVDRHNMSGDM